MLTLMKAMSTVAILAAAGSAAAQPATYADAPTTVVSVADLDITSPAGLRTLNGRVQAAATRLCSHQGRTTLQMEFAERRCMSTAITGAQASIERAVAQRQAEVAVQTKMQLTAR